VRVVGAGQAPPHRVAVGDQAGEGRHDPGGQEDVEQGGPAEHEVQAVERQEQPGEAAEDGRAGHAAGQADQHHDRQRAGDRGGDAPAELVDAEQPQPDRHQPLAERRVDDEAGLTGRLAARGGPGVLVGVGDRGGLDAEAQEVLGVADVVDLVEDPPGRQVEPHDPQQPCQQPDERASPPSRPGRPSAAGCASRQCDDRRRAPTWRRRASRSCAAA
jgi:hypothetical protein